MQIETHNKRHQTRSIHISAILLLVSASINTSAEEMPDPHIPVYFELYLNETDKLYRYGIDHPCGKTLSLRGHELPINDASFNIRWIYETSEAGKIITKWPSPVDITPVAIHGSRITVQNVSKLGNIFYIYESGQVAMPPIEFLPKQDENEYIDCPAGLDLQCSIYSDQLLKIKRILAFDSTCS